MSKTPEELAREWEAESGSCCDCCTQEAFVVGFETAKQQLESEPKWISVNESLPPADETVVAMTHSGGICLATLRTYSTEGNVAPFAWDISGGSGAFSLIAKWMKVSSAASR